jgi:ABC-type nitrate/sulfonate/bicarbonate transport system ATPase subunit
MKQSGYCQGFDSKPKDLLKDEPLASLATGKRRMLYNQLLQINQETNKTILLVTYNVEEAVSLGDRVIDMSLQLANVRKEFIIDLPKPRQPDHPLTNSITKEIMEESKELCFSPAVAIESRNDRFENKIPSTVFTN